MEDKYKDVCNSDLIKFKIGLKLMAHCSFGTSSVLQVYSKKLKGDAQKTDMFVHNFCISFKEKHS